MISSSSSSTPQAVSDANPLEALITQLSVGPDLRDVAAVLLRQHLREMYPALDLDPGSTMVGSPAWALIDDQIVAGPTAYQALTEILASQVVHGIPALYIEGEHFLAQQPISEPAVHLPVRIDEIANLLNLLAPVMLTAFQEQQLMFWNSPGNSSGPRWHALSDTLRKLWNVNQVKGWSDADCAMARTLYQTPAQVDRKPDDLYQINAYLIAIDLVDGDNIKHLNEVSMVVLIGKQKTETVILAHSLLNGYQKFDSLEKLGATLPEHINAAETYHNLQWRLLEPLGSIFDYQACALVSIQIDVIGSLDFSDSVATESEKPLSTSTPEVHESAKKNSPGLDWFRDALPDWLSNASLPDLNNYSRHLKDLAALNSQNAGKSYLDGILPISEYALSQLNTLHAQTLLEHAEQLRTAPELETALESLQLRVKSPVIWGTFTVPGKIDTYNFSVVELALQNLIAVPPLGNKTLVSTRDKTLPSWLTVDYLEDLVTRADIGTTYPALIKKQLLDSTSTVAARQTLFARHLRIQLPLLALQCKIRGEAGIDARGYRYVMAVLETDSKNRVVENQTIVMRALAFIPKRRTDGSEDEVANMFVIGPEDPTAGPCLLYRPMLDQPLSQYPSTSNLLYAIQQSSSLRDSVLAWLPDNARSDYANYVFPGTLPSPWSVTEFLIDSSKLTMMSGPIGLSSKKLAGDLPTALFKANAQAMVELADRQSVSNSENRWASFKRAGWILFNGVLPFLGRVAGVATWIWQIMDQLQALQDAHEQGDKPEQWAALTDALLNLAMAITLHIAARSPQTPRSRQESVTSKPAKDPLPSVPVRTLKQLDKGAPHEVTDLQQTLNISGAVNQTPTSLSLVLNRFKIKRPEGLGAASTEKGRYLHLYRQGKKCYAPVGKDWYEVTVDENGTVNIIDAQTATRSGPALFSNLRGEWFVDTRLRLRGGGSTSMTRAAGAEGKLEADKLRTRLEAFENRKATAQQELEKAHQAMSTATTETVATHREQFLKTLETQRAAYGEALSDLKALHVFSPTADYQQKSLGYLKAQLELTHAGIREALTVFTPKLRSVLNHLERQAEAREDRQIAEARQMITLNQDMITRLENIQARMQELKTFKRDGLHLIQHTRRTLPAYSIDDLKALQVTLARNTCLAEHSVATAAEAWRILDQIVDTADIAVQALRDTLEERSVARLDERIDSLNDLIEQFNVLDERLGDFNTTYAEQVLEEPFARLRGQLDQLNRNAKRNLVLVLEERDTLRSQPVPPPQPPRPKKKFIHTRYNGMLIGEPRLTGQGLETDLVDIKSPLTNKVIATFHQKTPGVWVERVSNTSPKIPTPALETSLNKGQTLLDTLAAFTTRMDELIKQPGRSPLGVEFLFHQQALQLEHISSAIDQALTDSNATESNLRSAAVINKKLSDAVDDLYLKASTALLKMTKEQPPTLMAVSRLQKNNAINIAKTVTRRRLKGAKALYLDEYTVTDRTTRKVLWYAHFLYSTSWVPNKSFLYARLKTPLEQQQAQESNSIRGLSGTQRLAYYRSMIGLDQAQTLFFNSD
ncbi:hypothetical protein SAMN04488483_4148 [Pseudomonas helmanticensis]|uniref:Uncharacterized protein n=1 Tax=Pseudomonas helmanticensis TaxID=1471381 RepID=A0ACD2U9U0_9PSED|nr:DUF6543 domain-containing protein [Pseudomonas helmanticensis]SMQ28204.1 hypothetical protein SAMN04488483_4148 [Pseudomonas helmanticensis]